MNNIVKQTGEIEMVEVDVNTWPENDKNALIDYIVRSQSSPSRMTHNDYRQALSEILFQGKKPIHAGLGDFVGINLLYKVPLSGNRNVPSNVGSFHLFFTTHSCIITTRKKESMSAQIESTGDGVAQGVGDIVTQGKIPNWLALEQKPIAYILRKTFAASLPRNLEKFLNGVLGLKYEKTYQIYYFDQILSFSLKMIEKINGFHKTNFNLNDLQEIRLSDHYLCTFLFKGSSKVYHLPNKLGKILEEEIPRN